MCCLILQIRKAILGMSLFVPCTGLCLEVIQPRLQDLNPEANLHWRCSRGSDGLRVLKQSLRVRERYDHEPWKLLPPNPYKPLPGSCPVANVISSESLRIGGVRVFVRRCFGFGNVEVLG